MKNNTEPRFYVETAILGAFLTLVYYLITNAGFAFQLAFVLGQIPLSEALILTQIWGAVFTVLYTVSNTFLFGIGAVPLVKTMQKLLGGGKNCQ
jgi:predicted secreted protein